MSIAAYVICATQRSGSTLLCDLLTGSGVAGEPNSYFRAEDIAYWGGRWGVEGSTEVSDRAFNQNYVAAMRRAGTAGTGCFGLRLMWYSVAEATARLAAASGAAGDLVRLIEASFGPTRFIHLSRDDKLAQAISLVRAQQSGLWHIAADGSERERLAPPRPPAYDAEVIAQARDCLIADEAQWDAFFADREIAPYRLSYERLAADPRGALAEVLVALGRDPARAAAVDVVSGRMADPLSAAWKARLSAD